MADSERIVPTLLNQTAEKRGNNYGPKICTYGKWQVIKNFWMYNNTCIEVIEQFIKEHFPGIIENFALRKMLNLNDFG